MKPTEERKRLTQEIRMLEEALSRMPEGSLVWTEQNGTLRYYHQIRKGQKTTRIYLRKSEQKTIRKLQIQPERCRVDVSTGSLVMEYT